MLPIIYSCLCLNLVSDFFLSSVLVYINKCLLLRLASCNIQVRWINSLLCQVFEISLNTRNLGSPEETLSGALDMVMTTWRVLFRNFFETSRLSGYESKLLLLFGSLLYFRFVKIVLLTCLERNNFLYFRAKWEDSHQSLPLF